MAIMLYTEERKKSSIFITIKFFTTIKLKNKLKVFVTKIFAFIAFPATN